MKGAVYYGLRDIRIEDVVEPEPGPGQIVIEVSRNGICGSDLHTYVGGSKGGAAMHVPGVVLGHEFSGIVRELGEGVNDLAVGTAVAIAPIEWCGTCYSCAHSWPQMCRVVQEGEGAPAFTFGRTNSCGKLVGSTSTSKTWTGHRRSRGGA